MFSFRRKPKKPEEPPPIRTSPSLPDLKSSVQGIPWPKDLVDIDAIRKQAAEEEGEEADVLSAMDDNGPSTAGEKNGRPKQGAVRISFTDGREPVMFHKPFHRYPDSSSRIAVPTPGFASAGEAAAAVKADGNKAPISHFYMALATPPEALDEMRKKKYERRGKSGHMGAGRLSQRRVRVAPTFNIMVVGSKGTGKSSLLHLLLETAEISPGATDDQRAVLTKFLKDSIKSTTVIQAACVEICESRFDRVLLSVIDTPGFDFQEGRELKLERQVNAVLKYVDAQYADTLNEESKVVRQQKGDQHIHLCIYMIDPASIMTVQARRTSGTFPSAPTKTRSEATISQSHPPELVPDTSSGDESDEDVDDADGTLTMSPAEIKVMHRISSRSNVLPVIAHADSLTDEKLQAVKEAVRKGLADAGIDFGVFGPIGKTSSADSKTSKKPANGTGGDSTNGHAEVADDTPAVTTDDEQEEEEEEERPSRPVIKLRPSRHRNLSRSRSRRDLSRVAEDSRRPMTPDATDRESVANVRFSAHIIAKNDISSLLPFALITPEGKKRRKRQKPASILDSPATPTTAGAAVAVVQHPSISSDDGHDNRSVAESALPPTTPASIHSALLSTRMAPPFLQGPPEDLKGVFTRKFRWGTVDVLDPKHCDFAALRTAILSTHLKLLKVHTREVLYERYRTEKLLARRATQQISEEERNRLLEDLGL